MLLLHKARNIKSKTKSKDSVAYNRASECSDMSTHGLYMFQ